MAEGIAWMLEARLIHTQLHSMNHSHGERILYVSQSAYVIPTNQATILCGFWSKIRLVFMFVQLCAHDLCIHRRIILILLRKLLLMHVSSLVRRLRGCFPGGKCSCSQRLPALQALQTKRLRFLSRSQSCFCCSCTCSSCHSDVLLCDA